MKSNQNQSIKLVPVTVRYSQNITFYVPCTDKKVAEDLALNFTQLKPELISKLALQNMQMGTQDREVL